MSVETTSHVSPYTYPDVVLAPSTGTVSGNCQKLLLKQGNAVHALTAKLRGRVRLTLLQGDPEFEAKPGVRSDA
jgi:hypothetical protein